ncbi:SufD family Fe-S cluster assembly protein [Candidatus Peregrinibacteria bacterium]|nr:SufD family Fe-S cluster assembly protein [Candidatus Peregrinibacteria bacterium]
MIKKTLQIPTGKSETITLEEDKMSLKISVMAGASLIIYDIQTEEKDTSREVEITLEGENSEAKVYGLYILKGRAKAASKIQIKHLKKNCKSSQIYRAILDDNSQGNFEGNIYVAKEAAGTEATQETKTLLLSEGAKVKALPKLEIFAEDVICRHGVTSGQIDEDTLFYMRSRGISEHKAKELLTLSFLSEVLDKIHLPDTKLKEFKKDCLHIYS